MQKLGLGWKNGADEDPGQSDASVGMFQGSRKCMQGTLAALAASCPRLRSLCIHGQRRTAFVGELPDAMSTLTALSSLQLHDCGFASAPPLPGLLELSVTDLGSRLPGDCHVMPELTQLTGITALRTSRCEFAGALPRSLARLCIKAQAGGVASWLAPAEQAQQLDALAFRIRRMQALRHLVFHDSGRLFPGGRVPEALVVAIGALSRLDSLHFVYCDTFTELPPAACLSRLTSFSLQYGRFNEFPPQLAVLQRCRRIDMSGCSFAAAGAVETVLSDLLRGDGGEQVGQKLVRLHRLDEPQSGSESATQAVLRRALAFGHGLIDETGDAYRSWPDVCNIMTDANFSIMEPLD